MMIDLHAKNQLNICKCLGKKCGKLWIAEFYLVQGPYFRQKSRERNQTQTSSVSHGCRVKCQKSAQYLQAFTKKVRKTV